MASGARWAGATTATGAWARAQRCCPGALGVSTPALARASRSQGCHAVLLLLPCSGARAPPCSKAAAVPGTPRLVQQRQQPGDAGARPRGLPAAAEPGSALPATRGQSPGVSPGAARQRTPSPHGRHPSSTQGTRRSSLHAGHLRELPIGTARPKASRLLETQLETRNRTSTRRIPGPDPHVCSSLIW